MDFKHLLLSPNGRINRQPYWIGTVVLFVAGFVAGLIPVLGLIYPFVSIYFYVCLYAKRLHDVGLSGWLQLITWIGCTGLMVAGGAAMFPAIMAFIQSGQDEQDALAMMQSAGGAFGLIALATLIGLAFHIWLGVAPGKKGANKYGPDPLNPVTPDVFE